MESRYIGRPQLKRVNPFEGLIVDAETWGDAHNYHRDLQRLHFLAFHGHGIVDGLEVRASSAGEPSVMISPGLAIDSEGNLILVTQPQRYLLQMNMRGTSYLLIQFREIPTADTNGSGGQPTRIMEAYRIQQMSALPDEPHLELARFQLDGSASGVGETKGGSQPLANEVDLRFRRNASVRPRGQITVGLISGGGKGWHQGLANLARELELQTGYQASFAGDADLKRGVDLYTLLYLDGSHPISLSQYDLAALALFLENGGVLIGESCGASGSQEQARNLGAVLTAVTQKQNVVPKAVEWGHPLLNSCHTFSAYPPGVEANGTLLEDGGIIFSSLDYACAWQGGHQDRRLPRSTIREALEFGVNIAVYAQQRKRLKLARRGETT